MRAKIAELIRKSIRDRVVRVPMLRRPSIRYCVENELLASMIVRTPSNSVRRTLNLPTSTHQTQLNQDIFALLMNQFRAGFFLEIGANDGYTLSNTVYLEEMFGWNGILVEPNPKYLGSLASRKNSVVVNVGVSPQKGTAEFIDAGLYGGLEASVDDTYATYTKGAPRISVNCTTLQEILDSAGAPQKIDFVSIDVEGGEVPIVEQMVSVNRRFKCGCIEHNNRIGDYQRLVDLLEAAHYKVVWEKQSGHDLFFVDVPLGAAE